MHGIEIVHVVRNRSRGFEFELVQFDNFKAQLRICGTSDAREVHFAFLLGSKEYDRKYLSDRHLCGTATLATLTKRLRILKCLVSRHLSCTVLESNQQPSD